MLGSRVQETSVAYARYRSLIHLVSLVSGRRVLVVLVQLIGVSISSERSTGC